MFVSRTSKSFNGIVQYVLWCSCDQQRVQLADALPTINTECWTTFEQLKSPCLHIKASSHILKKVDTINNVSPELDFSGIYYIYTKCSSFVHHILIADHNYASVDVEGGSDGRSETCSLNPICKRVLL